MSIPSLVSIAQAVFLLEWGMQVDVTADEVSSSSSER